MEQRSISNDNTNNDVRILKKEIRLLETKKKQLQLELRSLQSNCNHDFIESTVMKKCRKCHWTESIYY